MKLECLMLFYLSKDSQLKGKR